LFDDRTETEVWNDDLERIIEVVPSVQQTIGYGIEGDSPLDQRDRGLAIYSSEDGLPIGHSEGDDRFDRRAVHPHESIDLPKSESANE
jgi:hypothetical protein